MKQYFYLILFLFCLQTQAQFKFTGEVNPQYTDATAYLSVVEDYHKTNLFLTEYIIAECKIDSLNQFHFKGDFLSLQNKIYSIHVDNCADEHIGDFKHTINHCEDSTSIVFIANNEDHIHFPINNLYQSFCSTPIGKEHTTAIQKIDSLQEQLLTNIQFTKSDKQRNITYQNSFKALQEFSKSFNEPLAELYTYTLYADNKSIYHNFYLEDIKESDYYLGLLERLQDSLPKSTYTKEFERNLTHDQYPLISTKKTNFKIIAYILGTLLLASLFLNLFFFNKQKAPKETTVRYQDVLTTQEQKILALMHDKLTNKEIANTLFISVSTVKTHINNIYSKLNITSRKDIGVFFK